MVEETNRHGRNMMGDAIQAMAEKQGQLDIRFDDLTLQLGETGISVQLRGTLTIQMHLRGMADEERAAHVQHNVAALRA
jgi:hypothetical protein